MFNWISSKLKTEKSDHPLGSEASIDAYLAALSPGRPEVCLTELSEWLVEAPQLGHSLPAERSIRAIVRIDEAAALFAATCWSQFLAQVRTDNLGEQKLKALDTYYRGVHIGYMQALTTLANNPGVAGTNLGGYCGLFAQRALHALGGRLRVLHVRYRAPDSQWWESVALALNHAKNAGVINLKQRTYPDSLSSASPWIEYLIAVFFELAPLGNLVPQQMDLLYRLLQWLEPHFMVQESFSAATPYHVRLDTPGIPVKAIAPPTADPSLVFFGPGLAHGQLGRLRATIRQASSLPEWMRASACSVDKAIQVIDTLILHWSERPPERRSNRLRKEAKVLAVNGFTQMRKMIAFSDFVRSGRRVGYKTHLEMLKFERIGFADTTRESQRDEEKYRNAPPLESLRILETTGDRQLMDEWSMQDISPSGIGVVAPFLKPWLIIGAYICYRLDDEIDWRIGIIRRIHRASSGHPSVGIQTLPEIPRCAQVKRLDAPPGSDLWDEMGKEKIGEIGLDAIALSLTDGTIMIPSGIYQPDHHIVLMISGSSVPVKMKSLLHRNQDCDCIKYEFCEPPAGLR